MLENFVPSKVVETTHHELVFRLEDGCGSAHRFDCDEHGNVIRDGLPDLALHNLRLCRRGEVDGYTVQPGVVTSYTQSYIEDGGGTCVCGFHVTLHNSRANGCEWCGREYNGSGQLLTERSLWGEETGESIADLELDDDPEAH